MEIWMGRDSDGDGTDDVYIRYQLPEDHTGFTGVFLLLFVVQVIVWSFFIPYEDSDSKSMGPGMMWLLALFGSGSVSGLFAGRLFGMIRVSYYAPLVALAVCILLGFVTLGLHSAALRNAQAVKRMAAEAEADMMVKVRQKQEANTKRGMPMLEAAKAAAQTNGWKVEDGNFCCFTTGFGELSHTWKTTNDVPDTIYYVFAAKSPPPRDLYLRVKYEESTKLWTVTSAGDDKDFAIRDAHDDVRESRDLTDYWVLQETSIASLKPGKLKDLAYELAGYLKEQVAAGEKARLQEAERQTAASAAKHQQKMAEEEENARCRWALGIVAAVLVVGGFGGFLLWKGRWKVLSALTSAAPAPDCQQNRACRRYRFACPKCGTRYKISKAVLGKRFRCKKCKASCSVPTNTEQSPE